MILYLGNDLGGIYIENIIAIFEYKYQKYVIKFVEERKIGFFKIGTSEKLNDELTRQEINILNIVYNSLQVDLDNSVFHSVKKIGNNKYNIYYDENTHNYFWSSINKVYNCQDNIELNFRYNHEPNIVYNAYDKISALNTSSMFNKLVKIGKKYILVYVSSSLILSSLSGCLVVDNRVVNNSEVAYDNQVDCLDIELDNIENDHLIIEDNQEVVDEYNFDDIKEIIQNNANLSEEEKEFFYKLRIVFDEYNEYMDLHLIKERLRTLDIEYQRSSSAFSSGKYIVDENKIIITNVTCFKEVKLNVILHEVLHVFQSGRYIYFTNELSNEFFTREILFRLYDEGILAKEDFFSCIETDDEIANINDDNELLKEMFGQNNFVSGYMYHMPVYYALAEILPKEVLCSYQFNPENIEILKDGLKSIEDLSSDEDINRANSLIEHINDFRKIDIERNEYIYYYPDEQIYDELDYFYKKVKGKSVNEDFLMSLRMINYEIFSNLHFDMYESEYYEDIMSNLTSFLEDEKGLSYLTAASLVDKTILSDSRDNALIVGYLDSGESVSIIIDEELQKEYSSYLDGIKSQVDNCIKGHS